jgi:hypothetical protein
MGMQLPHGLGKLMNGLGRQWPMSDEQTLFAMGQAWLGLSGDIETIAGHTDTQAAGTWKQQRGAGVSAAQSVWTDEESPHGNLLRGTTGGDIIGLGLMICAAIVLVLKVNFIVQLIQLAVQLFHAMITAPATMGASSAMIPILMEITGRLLDLCVTIAMNAVMGD